MDLFLRFPGFRSHALTLSYDDAPIFDRRLIEIMSKYGIKGTFNVNSGREVDLTDPSRRNMSVGEIVPLLRESGNELAVHGAKHLHLSGIPLVEAMRDVVDDRVALEDAWGAPVRGMAYAFGAYSDAVVSMLAEAGIRYARTVKATHSFAIPEDFLRLHPTCHHKDERLLELCDEFFAPGRGGSRYWCNPPRLFYLWGHSYEFNDDNNWQIIEEFCKKMGKRENVWYATNIEVYDYVTAFRSLEWSMNGKSVYNPSATDVCLCYYDKNVLARAGEITSLVD